MISPEIERKFLVKGRPWEALGTGVAIRQGYLSRDEKNVVRIRVGGDQAWLTIKGPTQGLSRLECEYEIPPVEAESLFALCCEPPLQKTRYRIEEQGALFDVDVFEAENAGLVVAEIELQSEDETFFRPAWLGKEVSDDPRYRNSELSAFPYSSWED